MPIFKGPSLIIPVPPAGMVELFIDTANDDTLSYKDENGDVMPYGGPESILTNVASRSFYDLIRAVKNGVINFDDLKDTEVSAQATTITGGTSAIARINTPGGSGAPTDQVISGSPYLPTEAVLDLDNSSTLNAGVLTIPPITTHNYGVYRMIGVAGPYTINKIVNVPAYKIEARNTGIISTVFIFTSESLAGANDIVAGTPGSLTLDKDGDYVELRKNTGHNFNTVTDALTNN